MTKHVSISVGSSIDNKKQAYHIIILYIPEVWYMSCFRLYNKDAVIEYLLDKSAERPNAEAVAHIRGMKVCSC